MHAYYTREHTTSLPLLNLKNIVDLKIHVSLTLIVRPKMALLEVSPPYLCSTTWLLCVIGPKITGA